MNKKLFIVRGLPGSGKSTLAEAICSNVHSADDFFTGHDGVYRFDPSQIKSAHAHCRAQVETCMKRGEDVAVANTFTRKWEMEDYYKMAEEYGYMVFSLISENRHGGQNVHDVPVETISKMRDRFEVVL